jgi:hypothetical protein
MRAMQIRLLLPTPWVSFEETNAALGVLADNNVKVLRLVHVEADYTWPHFAYTGQAAVFAKYGIQRPEYGKDGGINENLLDCETVAL